MPTLYTRSIQTNAVQSYGFASTPQRCEFTPGSSLLSLSWDMASISFSIQGSPAEISRFAHKLNLAATAAIERDKEVIDLLHVLGETSEK